MWDITLPIVFFVHNFTIPGKFVWFCRDFSYHLGLILLSWGWYYTTKDKFLKVMTFAILGDMIYELGDLIVTNNEYDEVGLIPQNLFVIGVIVVGIYKIYFKNKNVSHTTSK